MGVKATVTVLLTVEVTQEWPHWLPDTSLGTARTLAQEKALGDLQRLLHSHPGYRVRERPRVNLTLLEET